MALASGKTGLEGAAKTIGYVGNGAYFYKASLS
jgi:hypothetical protein